MRRCYRAAALVLGTILTTGLASFNSCSIGTLTAYAAEDTLTEELATAFQQEVQAGAENVETEIPAEEAAVQPAQEEPMAELYRKNPFRKSLHLRKYPLRLWQRILIWMNRSIRYSYE